MCSAGPRRYYSAIDLTGAVAPAQTRSDGAVLGFTLTAALMGLAWVIAVPMRSQSEVALRATTSGTPAVAPPAHQALHRSHDLFHVSPSRRGAPSGPQTQGPSTTLSAARAANAEGYGHATPWLESRVSKALGALLLLPLLWKFATRRRSTAAGASMRSAGPTQHSAWAMASAVGEATQTADPFAALNAMRGDTKGAAIVLEGADIAIGNNQLLDEVEFKVMPRDRWGIVGPNGTGKSTLLKAITGQEPVRVSGGRVRIHPTFRVGYLEQKGVSGSTRTVREEVASRMDRIQLAKTKMDRLEAQLAEVAGDDALTALLEELAEAQEEFTAAGGYEVDAKVAKVLQGLGFQEADFDRGCDTFSGGWQMRIALGRLLLSEPEILILDEPTNHLDAAAKRWIARYLSEYEGTVLIVSHDENLLAVATSSIAEVRNRHLDLYRSRSYAQWEVEREEREARLQSEYERQQAEIERLQGFVDRFGASATKASQAQSRVKMIEKLKKEQVQAPMGVERHRPKLRLPKPPPCYEDQLELRRAAFGWAEQPIISDASVKIMKGQRIVVRGPNGAGKSTMLRALSGELPLKEGERVEGEGLNLGFFKQDLAQELPMGERAADVVQKAGWAVNPQLTMTEVRTVLGSLGLSQDKSLREVGWLSGGEKARVALACFALVPHNLLLLDEPSNHLDVETVASLTEALKEFKGAVVVVSHDRAFCESLGVTHVITVDDGKCTMQERALKDSDWAIDEMSAQAQEAQAEEGGAAAEGAAPPGAVRPAFPGAVRPTPPAAPAETNEERKARMAAERKLNKLEKKFEQLEGKIEQLQEEMALPENASDVGKLVEMQKDLDKLTAQSDAMMEEMEELMEQC